MTYRRAIQLVWLALAAGLLAAAGLLHEPLDRRSQQYGLVSPDNSAAESHPEIAILTMGPGALRAPAVNWLWMRAEELKDKGQHHESMQLSDLICRLEPRFPGVWGYHAWNMAWNISVTKHTPQERWLWINQGIRLLRDKGIPLNPKALPLYRELAWIFWSKIAGTTDEMHQYYKRYWAVEMQHLLGAPPIGDTKDVIDAFRPVAAAPVNRDRRLQGKQLIQGEQLAVLLADPSVAEYAAELAALGVNVDQSLLIAYNRFSTEEPAAAIRLRPPQVAGKDEQAVSGLINSPRHAQARGRLLAFVRSQILWNEYRMDSQWMLRTMEHFQAPLDWRLPLSHALYWLTYGMHVCDSRQQTDVESVNLARTLMNALKEMSFAGRLAYFEDLDAGAPTISQWADLRFIRPTNKEFESYIETVRQANQAAKAAGDDQGVTPSSLEPGHINFCINAMEMLVMANRVDEAQAMFDYVKRQYNKNDEDWTLPDVESFVVGRLNREGTPVLDVAVSLITAATVVAESGLAVGRKDIYHTYMGRARMIYQIYWRDHEDVARLRMQNLEWLQSAIVAQLLVRPEIHGVRLSLTDRANLYNRLREQTFLFYGKVYSVQTLIYDQIVPYLRPQCADAGLDFDKAFPPPADLDAFVVHRQHVLSQPRRQ